MIIFKLLRRLAGKMTVDDIVFCSNFNVSIMLIPAAAMFPFASYTKEPIFGTEKEWTVYEWVEKFGFVV